MNNYQLIYKHNINFISLIRSQRNESKRKNKSRTFEIDKLISSRTLRSANVQSPKELNFHRYDSVRRVTILGEVSTLNNSEVVLRFLQYDIIKIPMNNQSSATAMIHHRPVEILLTNDFFF